MRQRRQGLPVVFWIRRLLFTGDTAARSDKMAPMTAKPAGDPARSRDLARLRGLTSPHLPYPAAPIGPALAQMSPGDQAEVVAILSRLADPWEDASGGEDM